MERLVVKVKRPSFVWLLISSLVVSVCAQGYHHYPSSGGSPYGGVADPNDINVHCTHWNRWSRCNKLHKHSRGRWCRHRRGENPDYSQKQGDLTPDERVQFDQMDKLFRPKDTHEYIHMTEIQTEHCNPNDDNVQPPKPPTNRYAGLKLNIGFSTSGGTVERKVLSTTTIVPHRLAPTNNFQMNKQVEYVDAPIRPHTPVEKPKEVQPEPVAQADNFEMNREAEDVDSPITSQADTAKPAKKKRREGRKKRNSGRQDENERPKRGNRKGNKKAGGTQRANNDSNKKKKEERARTPNLRVQATRRKGLGMKKKRKQEREERLRLKELEEAKREQEALAKVAEKTTSKPQEDAPVTGAAEELALERKNAANVLPLEPEAPVEEPGSGYDTPAFVPSLSVEDVKNIMKQIVESKSKQKTEQPTASEVLTPIKEHKPVEVHKPEPIPEPEEEEPEPIPEPEPEPERQVEQPTASEVLTPIKEHKPVEVHKPEPIPEPEEEEPEDYLDDEEDEDEDDDFYEPQDGFRDQDNIPNHNNTPTQHEPNGSDKGMDEKPREPEKSNPPILSHNEGKNLSVRTVPNPVLSNENPNILEPERHVIKNNPKQEELNVGKKGHLSGSRTTDSGRKTNSQHTPNPLQTHKNILEEYEPEQPEEPEEEEQKSGFSRGAKIAGGIIGGLFALAAGGTGYHYSTKGNPQPTELEEVGFDDNDIDDIQEVETAVRFSADIWEDEV